MAGGQEGGAWIRQEVRGTERIQRIQFWHGSRSQGSWPTATNPRGTWATSQRETARDQHIRAARFTTMKMGAAGSAIVLFSPVNNAVDRIIAFRFSIRLPSPSPPSTIVSTFFFSFFFSLPLSRNRFALYRATITTPRRRIIAFHKYFDVYRNDYVDQRNWMVLNGIRFDGIKRFLLNAGEENKSRSPSELANAELSFPALLFAINRNKKFARWTSSPRAISMRP